MAGTPVGTIFAELALDDSKYKESQKQLLREATATTLNIEKNFKNLGVKSSAEFDLMRQKVQNSFERIKNHAKVTANDIIRAERAKNEQLKRLNEEQYGAQVSMIDKIKKNWLGMTAAVTAAYFAMQKAWNISEQAAQYEQSRMAFKTMVQSMGKDAETEFQRIKKASAGLVDDKSLVESANKAMSLGISIDSLAGLMEIARAKARDMGTQTTDAFNDIAIGIGRASPKILDNLGIIIKIGTANEELAASLGTTVEKLTDKEKQLAVTNAVLEAGKEALARYNLEQKTTKEKMDSLRATVANLNLLLGQGFIRAAAAAVGAYRTLNAASMILSAGVWKTVQAYHSLMEIVTFGEASERHRQIAEEARRYAEMDMEAAGRYWGMAKDNFGAMIATTDELAGAMQKIPAAASEAGESVADSAGEMEDAIEGAQEDFERFLKLTKDLEAQEKAAIEAGKKDFELYLAGLHAADEIEKERIKNIEKARKAAEKEMKGVEKFWKHTLENIHDATSDAIYNIIDNWSEGFSNLFDQIKNWFKRMLAEMIATALANPIKIAIGSVMGVGAGGSALAGTGGGGVSSLFDFSGISKIFSGIGASGWGLTNPVSLNMMRQGIGGGINWANVGGYLGLAYEAYNLFKSIGEGKYLTSAGIGIGAGIGALLGGPGGAALGAGIGDLVGGILDSVFGIGGGEPEFSLSHMQPRWGKERARWIEGRGVGMTYIDPNETPLADWDKLGPGEAIQKAYVEGRDAITTEFNTRMQGFLDALPEKYAKTALDALKKVDFNYLIPGGEWDISDAERVLTELLQGYADFLDQVSNDLVRAISKQYYSAEIKTTELYGLLTSERKSGVKELLTGDLSAEEFKKFLEDWDALGGMLASFREFVDPTITSLTTFEQVTKNVGETFDAYIEALERAGVEVEKLGDLEKMRAEVIAREVAILQEDFWSKFIEEMTLTYSGMTDYEKRVYQITKQFEEYIKQAEDLGLSEDQIAQIREWERIALEELKGAADEAAEAVEDLSERLRRVEQFSNAMSLMAGGSGNTRMEQISARYDWWKSGSKYDLGGGLYNWNNIINEILSMNLSLEGAEYVAKALGITLDQLLSDFDYIADQFTQMKAAAASLKTSLKDRYMQATMSGEDYTKWKAGEEYSATLSQLYDLRRQGIISYSEYETMRQQAWAIYQSEVEAATEAAKDEFRGLIDAAYDAWKGLVESIGESILNLQTSSDNPADVLERLGIQEQAIRDYTGGMGMEAYLQTLDTDEDRRNAIQEMMDLYGGYLALGQEAYQRPSPEYQAIYQEVLAAYQMMEGIAEGYMSEFDIQTEQLEVLKQIAINTGLLGSYDTGTDYVPRTGPYLLHQGEKVIPAGESRGNVYFGDIIIQGVSNGDEAVKKFQDYLRSPVGRREIFQAARGR